MWKCVFGTKMPAQGNEYGMDKEVINLFTKYAMCCASTFFSTLCTKFHYSFAPVRSSVRTRVVVKLESPEQIKI